MTPGVEQEASRAWVELACRLTREFGFQVTISSCSALRSPCGRPSLCRLRSAFPPSSVVLRALLHCAHALCPRLDSVCQEAQTPTLRSCRVTSLSVSTRPLLSFEQHAKIRRAWVLRSNASEADFLIRRTPTHPSDLAVRPS